MCLFYFSCENTITNNSDILDCDNIPNGSASVDECDVCGGDNSTCTDCVGIINGSAYTDNCNDCVGGTTGLEACPLDCAGIDGGASLINTCDDCVIEGDSTDILCIQGCDGMWANNGSELLYNDCGICSSNNSTCMVINEINYHSSDDIPEDWVELYNSSNSPINIGNWKLKDEEDIHVFTIPENTILYAGDFIVLCKDTIAFSSAFTILFPEVTNYIGDLGFGLKSEGDQVRLFDSNGSPIDSVKYDDIAPWPTGPDGTWPTLELIHPSRDNTLGGNWDSSTGSGTPGAENSVYVDE